MPGLVAGPSGTFSWIGHDRVLHGGGILVGVRSVGEGSVWLNIALLIPFVAADYFRVGERGPAAPSQCRCGMWTCSAAVLIAMWINGLGQSLDPIAGESGSAAIATVSRAIVRSL